MDRWKPLAPAPSSAAAARDALRGAGGQAIFRADDAAVEVRGLPRGVLLRVLDHVPLADLAVVARSSRALRALVGEEVLWRWRWGRLAWEPVPSLPVPVLDAAANEPLNEAPDEDAIRGGQQAAGGHSSASPPAERATEPPAAEPGVVDLLADLDVNEPRKPVDRSAGHAPGGPRPYFTRVRTAYTALFPFVKSVLDAPSVSSSLLFTHAQVPTLLDQCTLVRNVVRFVSPGVGGCTEGGTRYAAERVRREMRSVLGYVDMLLRAAFTAEEARLVEVRSAGPATPGEEERLEENMRRFAASAWDMRGAAHLLDAVRVPPNEVQERPLHAQLLADGGSVIADAYLASRAIFLQGVPHNPANNIGERGSLDLEPFSAFLAFLEEAARTELAVLRRLFPAAQRVAPAFLEKLLSEVLADYVTSLLQQARSVSVQVYLQAFSRSFKSALPFADALAEAAELEPREVREVVASRVWGAQLDEYLSEESAWERSTMEETCDSWQHSLASRLQEHVRASSVLAAQDAAAVKRSFLSTFKSALLTPVVPSSTPRQRTPSPTRDRPAGYVGLGAVADDAEDDEAWGLDEEPAVETQSSSVDVSAASATASPLPLASLLSLETAVELTNTARLALQRLDVFRTSETTLAPRVQPAVDGLVAQLFEAISERHVQPGFATAQAQISQYNPREHESQTGAGSASGASEQVTPLVLFFELVNMADTIQMMMQAFYDRVATRMLSKEDYTNVAVRAKKRFENDLDGSVAEGLSAGVELLIQHVEHIVLTHQNVRDFYPEADQELDLSQPTRACTECCETLATYTRMLATCADKAVLDLFFQEIGVRLHAVLCKHLKRQIISLRGGFQVIADLNAYYNFIVTLRQPVLTSLFAALKMVGSVFIVDEPKELAKMVRDARLSRGTLRPEEMYEFLRARADFKTIENNVDTELYGIKVMEDCTVA